MEGDDTRAGRIYPSGDVDYYKVTLGYDGKANFWLGDIPSNKDYDLYLYDSSGTLLESSATSGTSESIFNFDVVQEETYYMKVIGYNGAYSSSGVYQIRAKMVSYTYDDDYGNTYYDAIDVNVGQSISAQINYPGDVDFFLLSFGTAPDVNDYNFYQVFTTGSIDTYGIFGGVSQVAYMPSEYDPIYYTIDEDDDSGSSTNFKIDYLLLSEDYAESDPNYSPYDPVMYFVKVQAYGSAIGSYTLHFETQEDDVGNSANTAESISASSTTWKYYYLNGVDDVDYFKTVIPYNRRYKFTTSFSSDAITLEVYDENMNYLGQTSGNPEAYLQLDMYANDTYYFKVSAGVAEIACNYGFQIKSIAFLDEPDNFTPVGKPQLFALTNGGYVDTTFTDVGDIDCFQFTPSQTGSYNIFTSSDIDTKITLYDSDATTPLCTSYSFPNGDTDAWAARTLEGGKTYYIAVAPQVFVQNQTSYRIKITRNPKPNDEYFDDQWGLMNQGAHLYPDPNNTNNLITKNSTVGVDCNVLPVWNFSTGENIKIGILDTGVDTSHNDLTVNLSTLGTNTVHNNTNVFPSGEYPVVDGNGDPIHVTAIGGHGTHIAGIVAATTNNNIGIASVAPDAEIVPIKALGSEINPSNIGEGDNGNRSTNATVLDGVVYAKQNNIKIVNMSIQNFARSFLLENEIKTASNTLFVTISGNDSKNLSSDNANITYQYPGMSSASNMITVANINSDGELASDSNYGGMTHIAAPGTDIISTFPNQKTAFWSGTSMAAPFVSGTAALIWSYYPDLTPQEVKSRILNNVTPTSALTDKVSSGGYLNAYEAFCNASITSQSLNLNSIDIQTEGLNSQEIKQFVEDIKNATPDNEKTTEFFVVFSDGTNAEETLSQTLNMIDYEIIKQYTSTNAYHIRTNTVESADDAIDLLNELSVVEFAEPNYYLTTQ